MKEKLINIYNNDKTLLNVLLIFIIIQPFLDIEVFFTDERLSIFGFTIPTLVRCLGIGILIFLSLKNIKKDLEHKIYFWYFVLLLIYTILHHFININNGVFPDTYQYSKSQELFYVFRMLLPFFITYITKHSKISYRDFSKTIILSSLIISTIIICTNMLHIGLTSYESTEIFNQASWVEWFLGIEEYTFRQLASKGWFYSANQIGALLLMLLPINIYDYFKYNNRLSCFSTAATTLAMILLGTRVGSYGWLLVAGVMIILFVFFEYFLKEKIELKNLGLFLVISLFLGIVLMVSPIKDRIYIYPNVDADTIEIIDPNANLTDVYNFIEDNYVKFGVQEGYIKELYPYQFDHAFWLDVFNKSRKLAFDNRQMQQLITNRIIELNDNSLKYNLFGYSFSKFRSGGVYIEHDIVVHYATIGILGLLLLIGPYIAYLAYCVFKILKNKFRFLNICLCMSVAIILLVSIITGHILDELLVTIYIGFILGFLCKSVEGEVIEYEN